MPEAERPEEDVGPVQGEVEGHADARIVDVGREVDKVVRVGLLVHVLLEELVGGQMGRLFADAEVGVHDVGDVGHAHRSVEIRLSDEELRPGHEIA